MPDFDSPSPTLADPLRLALLHASFRLASDELKRRKAEESPGTDPPAVSGPAADGGEAAELAALLGGHLAGLPLPDLEQLHEQLAGNLLRELDRKLAAGGEPPGTRLDTSRVPEPIPLAKDGDGDAAPRVGLVSLPWMSPAMPSIQLATLASALDREGIAADVHELYVDYSARVGLNLYNHLGNLLGYLPEWVFSRHYYGPEHGDDLEGMIAQRPLQETPWPDLADDILEAFAPVTRRFLDDMAESVDWSRYGVLGFSLTISQLGASIAFARRVKLRHPGVQIVFGGSQCAGPMGRAILRICPYVDAVVHVEGELVFPEMVRRLRDGQSLAGLPGVSYRGPDGEVVSGPQGGLYRETSERLPLSYDAYFQRLIRLGLVDKMKPWLPFEGSRGCWYGQKSQCTFCGLHEIMEFRAWEAEAVLAELERLYGRYGIGRFYAMDLILPRDYLRTLLPEVARRGHGDWTFFWEIKANVRREELEILAAAGVRWVQPGIESLDADLLRLMKKGVSPLQNLQLLKWSRELGVFCGWNLLFGLPGETAESYRRMAEMIPRLHHLQPPSGGGRFQLHRFSPYFDHPEEHGIRWTGAHSMFRYAFPVPKEDLDELVYLHDFELTAGAPADSGPTEAAVLAWRQASRRGAALWLEVRADGSGRIEDSREAGPPGRVYELDPAEVALYQHLDAGAKDTQAEASFRSACPEAAAALDRNGGVAARLESWLRDGLLLAVDGKIVALAPHAARKRMNPPTIRPSETLDAGPWVSPARESDPVPQTGQR